MLTIKTDKYEVNDRREQETVNIIAHFILKRSEDSKRYHSHSIQGSVLEHRIKSNDHTIQVSLLQLNTRGREVHSSVGNIGNTRHKGSLRACRQVLAALFFSSAWGFKCQVLQFSFQF